MCHHQEEGGVAISRAAKKSGRSQKKSAKDEPFPIVAIGASAGGLKAYETFFKNMPSDSGMGFVLVQHLDPHHRSELSELLQNHSAMPVTQVEDNEKVAPDHVYVIPPDKRLAIEKGVLKLSERGEQRGSHAVIDLFFRSLASDRGEHAIAIVLSGTGTDGTQGLKALKEAGGITFAQREEDADYDGMPSSAAATGLVDFILDVADIPKKLIEVKDHAAQLSLPADDESLPEDDSEVLQRIFKQLKSKSGHDFSNYKRNTVVRRIGRRMQVHGLNNLTDYLSYFRSDDSEAAALVNELLISVTNFFRDPAAFGVLENKIVPQLFNRDEVRVWVTGCATGEEAYSVAMLLAEHNDLRDKPLRLQVFASDISEGALEFARLGVYPDSIATDVSQERLERFFEREGDTFRVRKQLRELILFTDHNLIKDPPFSNLNLVTCRNLLIYLNPDIQEQVYRTFHYALKPDGFLFLGGSESLGGESKLFKEINRKAKLFQHRETGEARLPFPALNTVKARKPDLEGMAKPAPTLAELARGTVLSHHAPAFAVVSEAYDIVYVSGRTGKFLEHPEGMVTTNIVEQARSGLALELRAALYRVFRQDRATVAKRVNVGAEDEAIPVSLSVRRLEEALEHAVVVFDTSTQRGELPLDTAEGGEEAALSAQLADELSSTRENLQTAIEELETSNEELRASNEELQSMNEELRSTTEELETSQEELQSTNEELTIVNQELRKKNDELAEVNSDLENLMASTEVGTLFLDAELRLKRFTPASTRVFNVIGSDLSRPFAHLSHDLDLTTLKEDAAQVLESLQPLEREASTPTASYIVRLTPYRTLDNRIDGVTITLSEVTRLKAAQQALTEANQTLEERVKVRTKDLRAANIRLREQEVFLRSIYEDVGLAVYVVDVKDDFRHLEVNPYFTLMTGVERDQVVGKRPEEMTHLPEPSRAGLRTQYETVVSSGEVLEYEVSSQGEDGDGKDDGDGKNRGDGKDRDTWWLVTLNPVTDETGAVYRIIGTGLPITERKRAEAATKEALAFTENLIESSVDGILAFDTNLRYTVFNQGMTRISGVKTENAVGNLSYEVFPFLEEIGEIDVQRATLRGEHLVREDQPFSVPETGETGFFEAHYSPLTGSNNEILGGLAVVRDVTERKEAADLLSASEERFRAVFEQGPSATCLLILDDWLVVDANDKCEDVLGYKRGELQDQSFLELDIWLDKDELESLKTLINTEDDKRELELRVKKSQDREGTLLASLELITFAGSEHVLLIFDDISEQKWAEEALQTARLKVLEAGDQARLALARDLHDGVIQQLLAINNALKQVETHNLETDAAQNLATQREDILKTVGQLRSTINHLRPAGLEELGLQLTLEAFVDQVRAEASFKLTTSITDTALSPRLSRTLYQVAQEALRNVVKHAEARNVRLSIEVKNGAVQLKVEDDGRGFTLPEHLSLLAQENHFGIIGVQERLSLLGGTLNVETAPGEGAILKASVPLEPDAKEGASNQGAGT